MFDEEIPYRGEITALTRLEKRIACVIGCMVGLIVAAVTSLRDRRG